MIKKLDIPLILLAVAGFLAPLIGGHVAIDAQAISPDSNPFLLACLARSKRPTLSHAILALLLLRLARYDASAAEDSAGA